MRDVAALPSWLGGTAGKLHFIVDNSLFENQEKTLVGMSRLIGK